MHAWGPESEALAARVLDWSLRRMRADPADLNSPRSEAKLAAGLGDPITPDGVGEERAFELFSEVIAPSCLNCGHPRYLGFVPYAPTNAATVFDLAVSASGIFADWWLEGSGAIFAENQALRWIADLAGLPASAGGVFVSGGTQGNLNGLFVAREAARARSGERAHEAVALCSGAHSSLRLVARVLDLDVVDVEADERGRMTGAALAEALASTELSAIAVGATAGSTNLGIVDDLSGVAALCERDGLWLHVDGAYGGAALVKPSARPLFDGIERADSFVVDPHKWLFAPLDCAALLYRDSSVARLVNTQQAEYLEVLDGDPEWNASDLAIHMTRRARGLPLWFSLAAHGTAAYGRAVAHGLWLARQAAELIESSPMLELAMQPELSVVVFRRLGWGAEDYKRWSTEQLERGLTLTVPTVLAEETLVRFCFINPQTTDADIGAVLDSLV